jgi:ABC-2 type transport system ATP-binding protein
MTTLAIEVKGVRFAYGDRVALNDVDLAVRTGEIFGLLGPNGGGKSTLFRLLSTLTPLQQGDATICGCDLRRHPSAVRQRLGVVFQAACVDRKLTVAENLACAGTLYGLRGGELRSASAQRLEELGLADRASERAETLSGGLRRRLELAQALMHNPQLLLLDEPSTGLDPGARLDLWSVLRRLRESHGTTIVLTTHLLEEADKADRLALLDAGRIVAVDTPAALRASVGGETIILRTTESSEVAALIRRSFPLDPQTVDGEVRIETREGSRWIGPLAQAVADRCESISLGRPTLEDVFVARTGRRLDAERARSEAAS